MTYIKLSDVLRNIKGHNADGILEHLIEDINSIPSIDPEEMIEEMIADIKNKGYIYDTEQYQIDILMQLLQKFKS